MFTLQTVVPVTEGEPENRVAQAAGVFAARGGGRAAPARVAAPTQAAPATVDPNAAAAASQAQRQQAAAEANARNNAALGRSQDVSACIVNVLKKYPGGPVSSDAAGYQKAMMACAQSR